MVEVHMLSVDKPGFREVGAPFLNTVMLPFVPSVGEAVTFRHDIADMADCKMAYYEVVRRELIIDVAPEKVTVFLYVR